MWGDHLYHYPCCVAQYVYSGQCDGHLHFQTQAPQELKKKKCHVVVDVINSSQKEYTSEYAYITQHYTSYKGNHAASTLGIRNAVGMNCSIIT